MLLGRHNYGFDNNFTNSSANSFKQSKSSGQNDKKSKNYEYDEEEYQVGGESYE